MKPVQNGPRNSFESVNIPIHCRSVEPDSFPLQNKTNNFVGLTSKSVTKRFDNKNGRKFTITKNKSFPTDSKEFRCCWHCTESSSSIVFIECGCVIRFFHTWPGHHLQFHVYFFRSQNICRIYAVDFHEHSCGHR